MEKGDMEEKREHAAHNHVRQTAIDYKKRGGGGGRWSSQRKRLSSIDSTDQLTPTTQKKKEKIEKKTQCNETSSFAASVPEESSPSSHWRPPFRRLPSSFRHAWTSASKRIIDQQFLKRTCSTLFDTYRPSSFHCSRLTLELPEWPKWPSGTKWPILLQPKFIIYNFR